MRIPRYLAKYSLLILLGFLCLTLWRIKHNSQGTIIALEDTLRHATVDGSWFSDVRSRLTFGSSDVWRSTDEANDIIPALDTVDPIAERTFYMLKTGADVLYERLPVHMKTTLKRFPYHQIYADMSVTVGDEEVVDVISMLPERIVTEHLPSYVKRRRLTEESWGWSTEQLVVDSAEGWGSDKFKNVPMMLHAFRNAPKNCDWFVIADDDTFIHSLSLGSLLRGLDPREKHYIGSAALLRDGFTETGRVGQQLKAKNPDDPVALWFAHGGSGYIISRGAVEALFWDPQREDDLVAKYSDAAASTCCGDAVFAYMLREELNLSVNADIDHDLVSIDPFQGENLATTEISFTDGGLCARIVSWHHLRSWEIQTLYDWESKISQRKLNDGAGVLYSDYYHDFILPFIMSNRDHYDNGAASRVYGPSDAIIRGDDEPDLFPANSVDDCIKGCEAQSRCLGWKFESKDSENTDSENTASENTCALEFHNVRKGSAKNPLKKDSDGPSLLASGWMLDRIRTLRSGEICDKLSYDLNNQVYDDDDATSEGWYFRRLDVERGDNPDGPVYA